ncbi:glycosyltransferase family 4 protein [Arsenicicoccus dermatophilus]|uniref:glycosyltransferase family 4 protein n=1 Tax=Arsenicicoccus dermatophilus TaxID=1076331 RepID=UPI001F4C5CE7|nr:glycosyltransferase family 4 protein [Arsenicicoccus dermatophilus]MCH8612360.1 glycosyltransferase family 4 protein [Arsenicicoccus dermatophilus]
MTAPLRVAYLVSAYPALSHAFIEREVLALRGLGAQVDTFTINETPAEQLHSQAMRADAATTTPVKTASALTWARAHLGVLRRDAGAWGRLLGTALRTGEATPKARLWQVFYLGEAVVLYDLMRRRGLRHVHAHFANVSADVARHVVTLGRDLDGPEAGWRWSFTMHGPTEFEAVDRFDLPAKVRSASGVSCISDFCRSQLMRMVEPGEWDKLALVRMTVDADRYRPPADGRAGREGAPLRVLYVGRLVPEKGGPVLLDAVRRLRDRGIPVQVRIIGSGPLEDSLREQIARQDLGELVELAGAVGQDHLPEHYHWADVFCLPSFQEGLPVVLMEALATELPVVTTRIAGVTELVADQEMGRVIPAGRGDALADALADEAADPQRRAAQGRAGRARVLEEFTPQTAGPAMADFLRSVR